jgi:hypothetical protein
VKSDVVQSYKRALDSNHQQLAELRAAQAGLSTGNNTISRREHKKPSAAQLSKQIASQSSAGFPGGPKKDDEKEKERKFNTTQKTEFMDKVKENYRYDKATDSYKIMDGKRPISDSITGKPVKYIKWDGCHGDIEAYFEIKRHLGSLDPETLKMYKGPVNGRKL